MSARANPPNVSIHRKLLFLNDDLYDALRWLFVSAVTWEAMRHKRELCDANQDAISMLASLTQARALYEFFFAGQSRGDDARACDFAPRWASPPSSLYMTYMGNGQPMNKRVSHLVYDRPMHSGGSAPNGEDQLNNQVLNFAKDLRSISEQFAAAADSGFRDGIQTTLQNALNEAKRTADHYGIPNPL